MSPCIFCTIVKGQAGTRLLYSDQHVSAFRDAHPVASTHILIVPNRHIASVNDLQPADESLIGRMFLVARRLAEQEGIHEGGYRLIVNTGDHGGQTVLHLHMHLIGGKPMRHPIG